MSGRGVDHFLQYFSENSQHNQLRYPHWKLLGVHLKSQRHT